MKTEKVNKLKTAQTKLGNEICLLAPSNFLPQKQEVSLVIGVFHGDEPQGKFLIDEYLKSSPSPQPSPSRGEGASAQTYTTFALTKAKDLRKKQTNAEQILWNYLRAKQFFGLKFRRQQPIDKYIADFVCFEKRLIIELDGSQHFFRENYDEKRTDFLNKAGFTVIRIWDNDIFSNIDGVLEHIKNSLSPRGRGLGRGGRSLLFIPCLNPDGMQLNQRTNANGVDLNRNFPTKNWGEDTSKAGNNPADYFGGKSAGSEIETQFVIDVIREYQPKSILTLHAPYKVVNFDGPAKELAQKISDIIKYPVEESIGYPTPGSFGTYAGIERQIPTITLELDETCPVENLITPVFEIFDEVL